MRASEVGRAVAAAVEIASALGLAVEDTVVLQASNKITVRLLPGDVLARVAPMAEQVLGFEVELAQRLAASSSPVAALARPGVYERDGFAVTLWTYYEPTSAPSTPADYASALFRLHQGLRAIDMPTPHFTDRVAEAQRLVASRDDTPTLADADRQFLGDTLRDLRRTVSAAGADQLLHGEPHPGNLLATAHGPLFIDLETCCRGPVEFDLAHAPPDVADHYPGIDPDLLRACRTLVLAMITTWRWDRRDQFPDGIRLGREWLEQLRALHRD
ncbi:phosphotransferase [Kutzneria sp. NPDC052558]|uniref:phosphotransferase n=1 Tax=Kutzneria sp. NPDC052558 TaxID=3364121 RepID=UPI0037C80A36